jgi:uncharacterized protein (TIGR03000 family)
MSVKKSLCVAVVAVSALALSAQSSFAFFGHHRGGGSCGSSGGWGGSWGGGSWGGGSWGGGYGSGGSWGGGYSSCGSSGGYSYYGGGGYYGGGYSRGYYDGGYASSRIKYSRVASSKPVTETIVSEAPAVKTRLTLHVPADAKVTLAGVETKQTGETRQFATSKLATGQSWGDYKVVVESTRDGKTLREERMINLIGGEDQDLAVNFAGDSTNQVAQR